MGDAGNLIITGFMGTGKSTVGQELARRLGRPFVDTDALIEARLNDTVDNIFRTHGEAHFRRLEAALCAELAARSGLVIATGGGALIDSANRELLSASGVVVCLTASADEIERRLRDSGDRPLLQGPEPRNTIATLLSDRAEAYNRIALHVETTGLEASEVADRVVAALGRPVPPVSIAVHHPGGEYVVQVGRGLLCGTGQALRRAGVVGTVALVADPRVGSLHGATVEDSIHREGLACVSCSVPEGERHKTLLTLYHLYDKLVSADIDRHGAVVALGGGVVGDIAGVAAATYLRGVAFVQVPTTLLAMVDASIGGKAAVDHPRGKNLVGAFKEPVLVMADLDTLATLPCQEMQNGLAETIKAALINDPELFAQLEEHGPAPLPWLVERAVRVKVAIVEEDPYEQGRRAVLNLGHTFAHALEVVSSYSLPHGQAVSVGLMASALLSVRLGLCAPELATRVEGLLARLGLPLRYRGFAALDLWQAMAADKKRRGSRLRFVLPRRVGEVLVTDQVAEKDVLGVLHALREG